MSGPNRIPTKAEILAAINDTFERMTRQNGCEGLEVVMKLVALFRDQDHATPAIMPHCSELACVPSPEQKSRDTGGCP